MVTVTIEEDINGIKNIVSAKADDSEAACTAAITTRRLIMEDDDAPLLEAKRFTKKDVDDLLAKAVTADCGAWIDFNSVAVDGVGYSIDVASDMVNASRNVEGIRKTLAGQICAFLGIKGDE